MFMFIAFMVIMPVNCVLFALTWIPESYDQNCEPYQGTETKVNLRLSVTMIMRVVFERWTTND